MTAMGRFLRSRRERMSPAAAGLGTSGRRRTPGLRREELALLAGISVDYLTRLEQGRERTPSSAVVAALADALRLDRSEREHLIALVGLQAQPELCAPPPDRGSVSQATEKLLLALEPMPAVVLEQWQDVLAWNPAYERLMGPAGLFETDQPNLLRFLFTVPASRTLFRDWMTVGRDQVSGLRAEFGFCHAQQEVLKLVEDLSAESPDFAELWSAQEIGRPERGRHRFIHVEVGDLDLEYELLTIGDAQRRTLVAYQAVDQAGVEAVRRLASGRRDHLRLVDESTGH